MWSVVGGLVSTFVLIRDLFAYFIPGAVLFGAVVLSGLLQPIVSTYSGRFAFLPRPEWLKVVAVVAICYVLGHVLVAIGYFVISLFRADPPVNDTALYHRYRYPSLFIELDRRRIIADFRFGLGVSLLLSGGVLGPIDWPLSIIPIVLGIFMLWVAHTARRHLAVYGEATRLAAAKAVINNIPPERQGAKPKAEPTG